MKIEWLDLTPSSFGIDHYYMAVCAQWKKKMDTWDKVETVTSKMFVLPYEKRKMIDLVLVYNSPKELQEDMLDRWDYRTENLYPLVANGKMAEVA